MDVDAIKQATDLAELIAADMGQPQSRGGAWESYDPCPFCTHRGCFKVNRSKRYYRCFSCGQQGDCIDWVMTQTKCDFMSAVRRLADGAGIALPGPEDESEDDRQRRLGEAKRKREVAEALTAAAHHYHQVLLEAQPKALDYLINRGISLEVIEEHAIGYCPNGRNGELRLAEHWQGIGRDCGILREAGLLRQSKRADREYEFLFGRIVLPNWRLGQVVDMQGRIWPERKGARKPGPKYLTCAKTIEHLWNESALHGDEPIITEGIPDALVLISHGFNAAAIYGTGAFKAQWADSCRRAGRVCYVPDTDKAGLDGAERTAEVIADACQIVRLPGSSKDVGEWFANGGTPEEFRKLMAKAQTLLEFRIDRIGKEYADATKAQKVKLLQPVIVEAGKLSELEREPIVDAIVELGISRRAVERDIAKAARENDDEEEERTGIHVKDKCIWNGDRRLANFTIETVRNVFTEEGCIRHVRLTNNRGRKSPVVELTASDMTSSQRFSAWCLKLGFFQWFGKDADLSRLWQHVEGAAEGTMIYQPSHVGWLDRQFCETLGTDRRYFLAADCVIDDEGEMLKPDEAGTFAITRDTGLVPFALQGSSTNMPRLLNGSRFNRDEVLSLFLAAYGNTWYPALCLAWHTSCVISEGLYEMFGHLPFLYVGGQAGTGKDCLVELLMAFWGIMSPKQETFGATTLPGLERVFEFYSGPPVWINEGRNEGRPGQVEAMLEFLRGAFMRQTAGSKVNMGNYRQTVSRQVRARLIHSGEDAPQDHALLTRYVVVMLSRSHRDYQAYNDLRQKRETFRTYTLDLLRNLPERSARIVAEVTRILPTVREHVEDERMAANYAMMAACYLADWQASDEFFEWLLTHAASHRHEVEDESQVNVFLQDLHRMISARLIDEGRYYFFDGNGSRLVVWIEGVYPIWAEEFRRRSGTPFKRSTLKDHMREIPWIHGPRDRRFPDEDGVKSRVLKAFEIDLEQATEPLCLLLGDFSADEGGGDLAKTAATPQRS